MLVSALVRNAPGVAPTGQEGPGQHVQLEKPPKITLSNKQFGAQGIHLKDNYHLYGVSLKQSNCGGYLIPVLRRRSLLSLALTAPWNW